jgi:hypothetical protein
MHFEAIIGACLESIEDFCVFPLKESIEDFCVAWPLLLGWALDAKQSWVPMPSQYSWKSRLLNWVLLSIRIRLGTPNLQTIDLRKATTAPWVILIIVVASGHFVNLSMVTKRKRYLPTALGNSPRISTPHTANGQEGGIICRA